MPAPSSMIQLQLALPRRDYCAFVKGTEFLRTVMGKTTPKPEELILHTLRNRDGRGLAEDYLESVRWPVSLNLAIARQADGTGKADG